MVYGMTGCARCGHEKDRHTRPLDCPGGLLHPEKGQHPDACAEPGCECRYYAEPAR